MDILLSLIIEFLSFVHVIGFTFLCCRWPIIISMLPTHRFMCCSYHTVGGGVGGGTAACWSVVGRSTCVFVILRTFDRNNCDHVSGISLKLGSALYIYCATQFQRKLAESYAGCFQHKMQIRLTVTDFSLHLLKKISILKHMSTI